MKKSVILSILILSSLLISGQIINIPGDYSTIQQGINNANDGDTVLVQDGTYIENINFNGKNITVSSYYLITQDTSYISQTIIDGDQDGSVVTFESGEDSTAIICGFTLRNGYSDGGGGIACTYSSPIIDHVTVEDCQAYQGGGIWLYLSDPVLCNSQIINNWASGGYWKPWGGGIYCDNSNPLIEDVLIKNNSAAWWQPQVIEGIGGGIFCDYDSGPILKNVDIINNYAEEGPGGISCPGINITFDSINRCNIYYNINGDIGVSPDVSVFIDTFSVLTPTPFYGGACHPDFNINVGLIELIDADLFVSPEGDNSNSGLTIEDPLKTIEYARSILLYNCETYHILFLLEGIYSKNTNGESFPVYVSSGLSLINISDTIITFNANNNDSKVLSLSGDTVSLSGFTITGGAEGGMYCHGSVVNLSNLNITENGSSALAEGGIFVRSDKLYMDNLTLNQNTSSLMGGGGRIGAETAYLQNLIISNNTAYGPGGGIYLSCDNATLVNCLINNNIAISPGQYRPEIGGGGIYSKNSSFNIINTTISNNAGGFSGPMGGGGGIYHDGFDSKIINSILWGNEPQEIKLMGYDTVEVFVDILHSNIKNGIDSISIVGENAHINWLEGNLIDDPQFASSGDDPFSLNYGSPCIEAGTPDTTGLNLPIIDLIGNIRIWDGDEDGVDIIDMGAYEYGSIPVNIFEPIINEFNGQTRLKTYPNPFNQSTTIELELNEKTNLTLSIYNQLGKEVKILYEGYKEKGKFLLSWFLGKLPSGIYFIKLQTDRVIITQKVVKR